jgi:hypothetical protein
MSLISPEVLHLLFALLGAGLGWYARHSSINVAPEVLALVEKLLSRQKEDQAHGQLQDLLDKARTPPAKP